VDGEGAQGLMTALPTVPNTEGRGVPGTRSRLDDGPPLPWLTITARASTATCFENLLVLLVEAIESGMPQCRVRAFQVDGDHLVPVRAGPVHQEPPGAEARGFEPLFPLRDSFTTRGPVPEWPRVQTCSGMTHVEAPVAYADELLAVLQISVPRLVSREEVALIGGAANQAALAWRNLELEKVSEELRTRAEARALRIDHVQRIGSRLKADLNVDAIATRVVEAAREALGFKSAVLNLVDRPGQPDARAAVVATCGIPPQGVAALTARDFPAADLARIFRPEFRLSRSYFIPKGALDISGETQITCWVREDVTSGPENAWRAGDELLVPFTDAEEGCLMGFLSVDEPESGLRPEAEEAEILEIFADQAVAALRNAALLSEARRLAEQDPLTSLLNHRSAHDLLDKAFTTARQEQGMLGLILMDLDDFKLINDSHGHQAGDLVVRSGNSLTMFHLLENGLD